MGREMTEQEWLSAADPDPMLEFVHRRVSERKLRLFACACCRAMRYLSEPDLAGVEVAERYADGGATETDLEAAEEAAKGFYASHGNVESFFAVREALSVSRFWPREFKWDGTDDSHWARCCASWAATQPECGTEDREAARRAARGVQADLLRDVIGNPFHAVAFDVRWRTPETVRLAESMYESCAFDRMPELADLLGEAGCAEGAIIDHCRRLGLHVRGCWMVDAVLGKA